MAGGAQADNDTIIDTWWFFCRRLLHGSVAMVLVSRYLSVDMIFNRPDSASPANTRHWRNAGLILGQLAQH